MEYKGNIIQPKCYQRTCKPEHFMVKYQGFGISESIIQKLEKDKVRFIMFNYIGKSGINTYFATVKQYKSSQKSHKDGEDLQKFVSIKNMIEL